MRASARVSPDEDGVLVSRARPSRKTEGSGVTAIRDSFLSLQFTGNHTSHVLLMARVWLDNSTRIWRALARAYLHFCAHQLLIIHVPIIAFLQNELLIAVTPDPSVFLEGLARETRWCPSLLQAAALHCDCDTAGPPTKQHAALLMWASCDHSILRRSWLAKQCPDSLLMFLVRCFLPDEDVCFLPDVSCQMVNIDMTSQCWHLQMQTSVLFVAVALQKIYTTSPRPPLSKY